MKRFKRWKLLTVAFVFSLLVALQPVVVHASETCGSGSHTGC